MIADVTLPPLPLAGVLRTLFSNLYADFLASWLHGFMEDGEATPLAGFVAMDCG